METQPERQGGFVIMPNETGVLLAVQSEAPATVANPRIEPPSINSAVEVLQIFTTVHRVAVSWPMLRSEEPPQFSAAFSPLAMTCCV